MIILGIDVGLNGALCFYDTDAEWLTLVDMPTMSVVRNGKDKREVSAQGVADCILEIKPKHAFIERVGAMPNQGVTSVFSFGRSLGILEGAMACMAVPTTLVSPQAWQKGVQQRGGKDGSRERAMQLFPKQADSFKLKKHDGRADAALISYYGLLQIRGVK